MGKVLHDPYSYPFPDPLYRARLLAAWHTRISAARNIIRDITPDDAMMRKAKVATERRLEALHRCPFAAAIRQQRHRKKAKGGFPAGCGRYPCPACSPAAIESFLAARTPLILAEVPIARHIVLMHQRLSVESSPDDIWYSLERLRHRTRILTRKNRLFGLVGGLMSYEIDPVGPDRRRGVLIHVHLLAEPLSAPRLNGTFVYTPLTDLVTEWKESADASASEEGRVWPPNGGGTLTRRGELRRRIRYVAGLRSIFRVEFPKTLDGLQESPNYVNPQGWEKRLADKYKRRGNLTARQAMLIAAFYAHQSRKLQLIRGWRRFARVAPRMNQ